MKPNHHPDDATLLAYAAGTLPEGFSLITAAHAESCIECQARIATAERLGGALLIAPEERSSGSMPDSAFDALWAKVATEPRDTEAVRESAPDYPGVPRVLARLLPAELDALPWRRLAPGVRQFVLSDLGQGAETVRLFHIRPGGKVPPHGHRGTEMTLLLRGAYADGLGRFRSGDVADLDESVEHQPVADISEPCICLIATDQRLRFKGLVARALQPLIGV